MAKLKEKIKELQATYGITEDAAKAVLALHEGDLQDASTMLTEEQNKVVKWNQWYTENAPNIQASLAELEQLRTQMDTLKAAGVNINPLPNTNTNTTNTNTNTNPSNLDDILDQREKRIYNNFSQVQKDLYNIQRQHMAHYKELPDIEPIEKLINEKGMTPWAAYQSWVEPMEKERTTKDLREQITKELTEKFQNENTRQGVNNFLSNKSSLGEEVTSPLDEVARDIVATTPVTPKAGERVDPNEMELMADFLGTMRNGRAGMVH